MRITRIPTLLLIPLFFISCKDQDKQQDKKSENNVDAARNFIRAALDGKFDQARTFMLSDSINMNYMDLAERSYERADQSLKDGYRSSSIRIYSPITIINDSTSIIIYSNSFKNDPDTLKVLRHSGQWLIDLKYLYEHDSDSLLQKKITTDTIK